MAIRSRLTAVTCGAALLLGATGVAAQGRFGVLAQHAIADVAGLRVVTIRDNELATCYTLFILEPALAPDAVPMPPELDPAADESVRRIRDAAERRDRQLAALKARASRSPSTEPNAAATYELDRRRIEEEYEQVLRTEIPGSAAWATAVPGTRSGGFEDSANALRRALIDPDPTSSMKTLIEQFGRLDALLRRLIEAPRMTVSGPNRCAAEAALPVTPVR